MSPEKRGYIEKCIRCGLPVEYDADHESVGGPHVCDEQQIARHARAQEGRARCLDEDDFDEGTALRDLPYGTRLDDGSRLLDDSDWIDEEEPTR